MKMTRIFILVIKMLKQLYFKIWTIHGHYNWNSMYSTIIIRLTAKIEFYQDLFGQINVALTMFRKVK
jgi:hypothetical protein